MALSKRLHPMVEWLVAGDLNRYLVTSGTPTPEEVDEAYAYAVENDCVVRLRWTAYDGWAGPHYIDIHADINVAEAKEKLAHICYAV